MKGVSISLENLCVSYGTTKVLKGVSLSVEAGEFVALLGASGCGKTTLLRALAGFVPVESGRMDAGDRSLVGLAPERRDMAMMFQSYALWPHMSVAQNIGYGLRLRKWPHHTIEARVQEMISLVGLDEQAARNVTRLSGGQRQRVALARALAIDPPILLLDEPLSNLDAGIRQNMRHEIKSLQKRLGLTTVLVTHDREEAMAMADRIVILDEGKVAQVGAPEDVYHRPDSAFVAAFMGAENTYPVEVTQAAGEIVVRGSHLSKETRLPLEEDASAAVAVETRGVHCAHPPQGQMVARFRSEAALLTPCGEAPEKHLALNGRVTQHSYMGAAYRHSIQVGEHEFFVDHPARIPVDQSVDVCIPAAALHLFSQSEHNAAAG